MYNIAKLEEKDRQAVFEMYVYKYRESPEIVEKDFWVTLFLDYLFNKSKYKDSFIFKGGTSLSKCFGIIDRFSEDIDLILNWNSIGFTDEDIYMVRSNTAQLKYNKSVDDVATKFIETEFLQSLKVDFQTILGKEPIFEMGDDKHIINFYYPSSYNANKVGILQCIRLEIGPLAERIPCVERNIKPLIEKLNISIISQISTTVKCISPERTFWEKILILHQEAHRPTTKNDISGKEIPNNVPRRYSRHYYDVWKISQTPYKEKAINNLDLLYSIINFKKKFYHYSWDNLEKAVPGTIVLVPSENRISELRRDFESMKMMINDSSIKNFDEVISHLKDLEIELNKL